MIALEMAGLRFDRAAAASALSSGACRVLLSLSGDVHVGPAGVAMTTVAFVEIRIRN